MKKLFLFGDSITAGYFEHEITDLLTLPVQRGLADIEVVNAGMPGDTTADGLARMATFVLRYNPDYVTVFFGANDGAIDCPIAIEEYQANLNEIISRIGPLKVLLLSPPYTSQRYNHNRPLEQMRGFVLGAEAVALETGVLFVNVQAEMIQTGDPESLLQEDGLHFSLKGYDFLANLILSGIKQLREKE
ncbi:esterase [Vagococcus sp. BWB3-3]|uniref:Esterase n=1 Tax=Vagococcus allomyrinae TaxID=2794353 RepID=A0A940SX05_9ENTE|nr:esterase [Vagococcus allomyrinae]